MNPAILNVSAQEAYEALRQYKEHRNLYDKRDWEIERIYRAIAKGQKVISVNQSIQNAGLDERGRPRLAICIADANMCACERSYTTDGLIFKPEEQKRPGPERAVITVPFRWPVGPRGSWSRIRARLPRIPPQHRPASDNLANYHLLWEADWEELPRDPMLLRRIGEDAWTVLAAWDLTDVEMNVLRAHRNA